MTKSRPRAHRNRPLIAAVAAAAAIGCSQHSDSDIAPIDAIGVLLQARALAADAPSIWPGFMLGDQVLVVNVPDTGPVYAVGPGAGSAEGFEPLEAGAEVFIRRGAPPEHLTGMDTDLRWGTEGRRATMVPYRGESTLAFLLHEAFHTHQASLKEEELFPGGGGNTRFPQDDSAALAALNLESRLLADALLARSDEESRRLARLAVAMRESRCHQLPDRECDLERALELREGSARWVEWQLLERAGLVAAPTDSLSIALTNLGDGSQLGRFHFYETGQAWMRLLDRHVGGDWREAVQISSPDRLLAEALGGKTVQLVAAAMADPRASEARAAASAFLAEAAARRDSIVAAFHARGGLPIRMRSPRGPNRATGDPNARSAMVEENGDDVYYVVGLNEARHWYPGDSETTTVVREALRIGGCGGEEFCLTVIAPLEGRTIHVDDTPLPLDRPGSAQGETRLELPSFEFASRLARVTVFPDSVRIDVLE